MRLKKTLLTLAAAAIMAAALAATASAAHLRLSAQTLRSTWRSAEFIGGFSSLSCNLTLESSFHSATLTKTTGALIGYITRASIGPCPAGSATVLTATLPWHERYKSFTGTLPNIAGIVTNVIGMAWRIREGGLSINCLATSTATEPATLTYNQINDAVTSVSLGGTIPCEGISMSLKGTSSTNSAQSVTLI